MAVIGLLATGVWSVMFAFVLGLCRVAAGSDAGRTRPAIA